MEHTEFKPWIGVDLDKTLAFADSYNKDKIGDPVPEMLERVRSWLRDGKDVKVFTARAHNPENIPQIRAWLDSWGLQEVGITNEKDPGMTELWDDKAVSVAPNTGCAVAAAIISFGW